MKVLLLAMIIASHPTPSPAGTPCGVKGDNNAPRLTALNLLKNRATGLGQVDHAVSLKAMLAPGNDVNRFMASSDATITGYVAEVKPGGIESCNCHAKDAAHRDTHIALTSRPNSPKHNCVIVEVTPRMRKAGWDTASLRRTILHKTITVSGHLLFDSEHAPNASNTNPNGSNNWRATAWEIHPVVDIR